MAEAKKKDDLGQSEVQAAYDEAAAKGYFGTVPEQPSNEAFSIQSGPESPTALEQHIAINQARLADQKASPATPVDGKES